MSQKLLGGVEAGGTKMVCAVAYDPCEILHEERFPTEGAQATLDRIKDFFERMSLKYELPAAIGYGTFGPAVVDSSASDYGSILATPKPGWEGENVIENLKQSFPDTQFSFDTDVNAAALGEGLAGAAQGLKNFIYITVGTGIGGGIIINGRPLHGRPHAEIGHMLIPEAVDELESFQGSCPFHGKCLEGLASGTAMAARWGVPAYELDAGHLAWLLQARYLAYMVQNLIACYAPEKIILGGGVMEQDFLLGMIREELTSLLGGYWDIPNDFLVSPALGNKAGITGALLLASSA